MRCLQALELKAMKHTEGAQHIGDLLRDHNIRLKGADALSQRGFTVRRGSNFISLELEPGGERPGHLRIVIHDQDGSAHLRRPDEGGDASAAPQVVLDVMRGLMDHAQYRIGTSRLLRQHLPMLA